MQLPSMPQDPKSKSKVLVIGLDGATLDLIRPWSEQGKLPALARLMEKGAWGELSVQLPPSSVPNWPSFSTGKNPGKHGVLWWIQQTDGSARVVDSRSIKGKTIWEILSEKGRRVAVVNVPVTYPPQKINGVMVTGLLTPPTAKDYTFPPELKAELDAQVGGYRVTNQLLFSPGGEEDFLQDWLDVLDRQLKASLYLLQKEAWDLFLIVFNLTDTVVHKFWKYMDPDHPAYNPEEARQFGDAILRAYQAADRAIEELVEAAGEDCHLMVMSDHGGGGYYEAFFANNWLLQQGYLQIRKALGSQIRYWLFRAGVTINRVYPVATRLLSLLRGSRLREQLSPRGKRRDLLFKFFLSEEDIDWSKSRAHAVGDFGQFYINLRGKSPNGIVEPGQEYEDLRDEILSRLENLVIPATGKPYLMKGYKKEELYHGPEIDGLPDIICEPTDMRYVDTGMGFMSNQLFDKVTIISGTHRLKGILFLAGPDVQPGPMVGDANIIDIAPTILYLLDEAIPDDMDGRVVSECLREDRLIEQPIRMERSSGRTAGEVDRGLTEEEEMLVKNQLRDLGYIS
jgi:predicted AlkP superfamily phosphohydrolase/phosphomutase